MTENVSIFNLELSHGDTVESRKTYPKTLDVNDFKKGCHRIVPDGVKKDGLYFCAANFGEDDRKNENIKSINALVFDVDKSTRDAVAHSIKLLRANGIEFICYTTASHNPEVEQVINKKTGEMGIRIGYRFVMIPPRQLNLSEYKFAVEYIAHKYQLDIDENANRAAQAMFYPTVHESNKDYAKVIVDYGVPVTIPEEVMEGAAAEEAIANESTNMPVVPPAGIDPTYYLATLLDVVKAESFGEDYEPWLDMSMAIHHQTQGTGKQMWNDWSAKNPAVYDASTMTSHWNSFNTDPKRKGITLRTVLNWQPAKSKITNETRLLCKLLRDAENMKVVEGLRLYIAELSGEGFIKGIDTDIAKAYSDVHKRLLDVTVSQSQAIYELRSVDISQERKDFFYDRFVYIAKTGEYFELSTGIKRSGSYMDDYYTEDYGRPNNQGVPQRWSYTMRTFPDYTRPRIANDFVYTPEDPNRLISDQNGYSINVFKHDDWPKVPTMEPFDELGSEIDARVNGIINLHFDVLSDSRPEVKQFLLQYIGHLRQRPGTRIHHAVCITSAAQGIGKSITQALITAVLGASNVKGLQKQTMQQANFNSYVSAKKMVQVIDEFDDLSDRRSAEILTSLKSAITSNYGPVSFKRENDEEDVPYYSSYWLFSNNRNVLNGTGGRRWSHFDIRNMYPSEKGNVAGPELEDLLGRDRDEFFDDYLDLLRDHPERLAAFFEALDLTGFNPNKPLLMKRERESGGNVTIGSVINSTFKELTSDNNHYVNNEIVKVETFQRKVISNYRSETGGDEVHSGRAVRNAITTFLTNKGFASTGRKRITGLGYTSQCGANAAYTRGNQADILTKYQEIDPPNQDEEDDDEF